MGNFCTKCGKALADGEVCSCQSAAAPQINPAQQVQAQQVAPQQVQAQQVPPQQAQAQQIPPQQVQAQQIPPQQYTNQQFQQQTQAATGYFKDLFKTSIDVWVAPATKGKEYVKSGKFGVAIGILVAQAIAAMILGICFEARSGFAMRGYFWRPTAGAVALTYVKVIFGTLFFSAAFSAMLAGLLLAFNLIAKNKMNFKQALCLASVRGVILIPAMGVALIFVLISPLYGGIFAVLINLYGIIAMMKALPVNEGASENVLVHLMSAAIGIFAVVSLFIMLTVGGLLYASTAILSFGSL